MSPAEHPAECLQSFPLKSNRTILARVTKSVERRRRSRIEEKSGIELKLTHLTRFTHCVEVLFALLNCYEIPRISLIIDRLSENIHAFVRRIINLENVNIQQCIKYSEDSEMCPLSISGKCKNAEKFAVYLRQIIATCWLLS